MMHSAIMLALVITLIILIPGWLWARLLIRGLSEKDFAVQLGLGLGLGLAIVPSFMFFINAIFAVPIGRSEILFVSLLLIAIPLLVEGLKRRIGNHPLLLRLLEIIRSLER